MLLLKIKNATVVFLHLIISTKVILFSDANPTRKSKRSILEKNFYGLNN